MDLGPVFVCEWRRISRQRWFFVLRSVLVGGLLIGLLAAWWGQVSRLDPTNASQMARAGEWYFGVIVVVQLSMVLLAAPAATAGSFSTEMARGHVYLMLVCGLRPTEIIFGILLSRLLSVLVVVACVIPVLSISSHLGGIPPVALVRLELVSMGTAALGCALALAVSIGARRLHEALLATYALLVGWVLAYPTLLIIQTTSIGRLLPGEWIRSLLDLNPFWLILGPLLDPSSARSDQLWIFMAGSIGLALALSAVSSWRLKPSVLAVPGRSPRESWLSRFAWYRGVVSLDSQPVYWRECRLQQPSSWFGLLWGLYVAGAVLFSLLAVAECATSGVRRTPWAGPFNGFQTMVGLLILSIVAPAALAEDRARGNLELLLSTPVSSRCLVLSKWCAYYRTALGLAVLPTIVAFAHAVPLHRWVGVPLVFGMVLAHGAAVTSLGIALATWVSRIDRALILSAAASVLVTVAWIPLILFLFGGNDFSLGLASGSPLLGVGVFTTELAHASTADWPIRLRWALFWIIAYCGIAVGLLWATLASFDRCLGRIANSRPSAQ